MDYFDDIEGPVMTADLKRVLKKHQSLQLDKDLDLEVYAQIKNVNLDPNKQKKKKEPNAIVAPLGQSAFKNPKLTKYIVGGAHDFSNQELAKARKKLQEWRTSLPARNKKEKEIIRDKKKQNEKGKVSWVNKSLKPKPELKVDLMKQTDDYEDGDSSSRPQSHLTPSEPAPARWLEDRLKTLQLDFDNISPASSREPSQERFRLNNDEKVAPEPIISEVKVETGNEGDSHQEREIEEELGFTISEQKDCVMDFEIEHRLPGDEWSLFSSLSNAPAQPDDQIYEPCTPTFSRTNWKALSRRKETLREEFTRKDRDIAKEEAPVSSYVLEEFLPQSKKRVESLTEEIRAGANKADKINPAMRSRKVVKQPPKTQWQPRTKTVKGDNEERDPAKRHQERLRAVLESSGLKTSVKVPTLEQIRRVTSEAKQWQQKEERRVMALKATLSKANVEAKYQIQASDFIDVVSKQVIPKPDVNLEELLEL